MLESLQPLLDTTLDAVVVMNRDGEVAAWNAVAQATFGWSSAEAMGRPMSDLIIPPQHREAHSQGLARFNRTGEARVLNHRIEISAIDSRGREFPVELSITTARAGDQTVFVGFLRDITSRRDAEARLRRQAREARLLFDVTRLAADTPSFEDALRACLKAICDLTGWPVGHALVRKGEQGAELVSTRVWHEDTPGAATALRQATEQLRFTVGVGLPGVVLETGEPTWVSNVGDDPNFPRKGLGYDSAFGFPVRSEGKLVAVLEFFTPEQTQPDPDLMLTVRTLGEQVGRVLERKRTDEYQRLLVDELNHRVKNTLAVVQSIAMQSFRGDAADPAARRAFESRLAALAAAHDVLTAENWEAASLHEIIERTGVGCGADAGRVRARGPHLRLSPRTAVALTLALHELCTNAIKYGALSTGVGGVDIGWSLTPAPEGSRLRLEWRETGGPPVAEPTRRGFGSRMIEQGLAAELGGAVEMKFLPEGVECVLEAVLPAEV